MKHPLFFQRKDFESIESDICDFYHRLEERQSLDCSHMGRIKFETNPSNNPINEYNNPQIRPFPNSNKSEKPV